MATDIVFFAFKNRASLQFVLPVLRLADKRQLAINLSIICTTKYYFNLKSSDHFRQLEELENIKKCFYVVAPWVEYDLTDCFRTFSLKEIKSFFFKIYRYASSLCYFVGFLSSFSHLTKECTEVLQTSLRLLDIVKSCNLVLLSGTQHCSTLDIYCKTLEHNYSPLPFVWLPHAPHHGSCLNQTPSILAKTPNRCEIWLPSIYEKLDDNTNPRLTSFNSGYPPFSTSSLQYTLQEIENAPKKENIILLLRQVSRSETGTVMEEFTTNLSDLRLIILRLNEFHKKHPNKELIISLHPSLPIDVVFRLVSRHEWLSRPLITRNYFTDFLNTHSIVIGFYTTVLLQSALLGVPTFILSDKMLRKFQSEEPALWTLYTDLLIKVIPILNKEPFQLACNIARNGFSTTHNKSTRMISLLSSDERCFERLQLLIRDHIRDQRR